MQLSSDFAIKGSNPPTKQKRAHQEKPVDSTSRTYLSNHSVECVFKHTHTHSSWFFTRSMPHHHRAKSQLLYNLLSITSQSIFYCVIIVFQWLEFAFRPVTGFPLSPSTALQPSPADHEPLLCTDSGYHLHKKCFAHCQQILSAKFFSTIT